LTLFGATTTVGARTMKPSPLSIPESTTSRWWIALAACSLTVAALAAYWPSFAGVFVYDDEPAILRNPTIRQLWPLSGALQPPADATVSGRPVANLSFAVNYALSGTRVWSYHAANFLIHLCAGLTLFGIVRRTRVPGRQEAPAVTHEDDRRPAGDGGGVAGHPTLLALVIALLWTLHPLQTESVTYVVQRVESLMALFFLLTFYCFIRSLASPHPLRWRGLAVVLCLLGMGTKEVMATAPVLLLLYDRTFVGGSFRQAWAQRRGFYLALAATWLPLAALVASTGWNRGATVGFDVGMPAPTYWLTQFEAVVHYLRLSFWPHPLVFDYATALARPPVETALYAGVVLALVAATCWALRYRPALGFLGAWFLVILAPTSVVPSSVQMIVEHRMYLPLAAVVVATVWGVQAWLGRRSVVLFLVLAAGLGWCTAQRNTVYHSERALWSDTLAQCPDNDRAHNNLGNVLIREGEVAAAIAHFEAALRLRPEGAGTHYNLGNALQRLGRTREAIAQYEQALQLTPGMPDAQTALGVALEAAGRPAAAIAHYEQALRLDPDYAEAHHRLGIALAGEGRLAEAIGHFERALRDPATQPEVHNNLGTALRAAGRFDEALRHYEQALQIAPTFAAARTNMGRTFVAMNRLPEAIAQFTQALEIAPASPEGHNDLGMVLLMAERAPEAMAHFEEALRLNPHLARAHLNLAIALESVGRANEAALHYAAARELGIALPPSEN